MNVNQRAIYTTGDILACLMGILFGMSSFGQITP